MNVWDEPPSLGTQLDIVHKTPADEDTEEDLEDEEETEDAVEEISSALYDVLRIFRRLLGSLTHYLLVTSVIF